MTHYSAIKRKSERERVALLFETMAARVGATCERNKYGIREPRRISLYLVKDGCAVSVDLDGASQVGCFLAHWFFDTVAARRGRLFAPGFDGTGYHAHHKATMMAETAEDLCQRIEGALLRIDDGTAFVLETA